MTEHRRAAVAAMLGARSMAVVGASDRPDSFGARMVLEAQRGSARVHLVNPRHDRIGELLAARESELLRLDRMVEEPVDLVLDGRVVARGELMAVDGAFAVRITELPQPLVL